MKIVKGPIYYNQIKFEDRFIHNFGDRHDESSLCDNFDITFAELIRNTIKTHDKIDIFIEERSPTKFEATYPEESTSPTIDSIILDEEFKSCFTLDEENSKRFYRSKKCIYPNARFHSIDIRMQLAYEFNKKNVLSTVMKIFLSYKKDERTDLRRRLEELLQNQLKYVKEPIKTKLQLEFDMIVERIKAIDIKLPEINEDKDEFKDEKIDYSIFIQFTSGLMDIFLLSRLLRVFKDGSYAKNCILFTGLNHAIRISNFFNEIGADVSPAFNEKIQCVKVDKNLLSFEFNPEWLIESLYHDNILRYINFSRDLYELCYQFKIYIERKKEVKEDTEEVKEEVKEVKEDIINPTILLIIKEYIHIHIPDILDITEYIHSLIILYKVLDCQTVKEKKQCILSITGLEYDNAIKLYEYQVENIFEEMNKLIDKLIPFSIKSSYIKNLISQEKAYNLVKIKKKIQKLSIVPYEDPMPKQIELVNKIPIHYLEKEECKSKLIEIKDIILEISSKINLSWNNTIDNYHVDEYLLYLAIIDDNIKNIDDIQESFKKFYKKIYKSEPPQLDSIPIIKRFLPLLPDIVNDIETNKDDDDIILKIDSYFRKSTDSYQYLCYTMKPEYIDKYIEERDKNREDKSFDQLFCPDSILCFLQDNEYYDIWNKYTENESGGVLSIKRLIYLVIHKLIQFIDKVSFSEIIIKLTTMMIKLVEKFKNIIIEPFSKEDITIFINDLIILENVLQYTWEQEMKILQVFAFGKKQSKTKKSPNTKTKKSPNTKTKKSPNTKTKKSPNTKTKTKK